MSVNGVDGVSGVSGVKGETVSNGARYQAAKPCGRQLFTLSGRGPGDPFTGTGDAPAGPAGRMVDRTDSRERAVLMRAFRTANTQLASAQAELGAATAKVLGSAERVRGGIEAVERFTVGRSPARARRSARRLERAHATDGPEDLRRSPVLWRWVLALSLVASAVFEAAFLAKIVQGVIGAEEGSWEWWLAYLPGVGVTVCLLAAGTLLADSVFRLRTRADRKPERRRTGLRAALLGRGRGEGPQTEKRADTDLPWPNMTAPVLLTAGVLGMVAVWAYLRTERAAAEHAYLEAYRPAVVALILTLSVSAILAKVLAHNPYADRAREVGKATEKTEKSARALLKTARDELAVHVTPWSSLRAAAVLAEDRARRTLDDACIALVEERARTGAAGGFDFPLGMTVWPYPAEDERADIPPGDTSPRLRLELLDEIKELLDAHAPSKLHARLDGVAARLNSQWEADDDIDVREPDVREAEVRESDVRESDVRESDVRESGAEGQAGERVPDQPTRPGGEEEPAAAVPPHDPAPGTEGSA